MKTREHSGRLVAELRHLIKKSQSQFAAMIGVSKHTIISVENGRNELSRNLAQRIQVATGASLLQNKLENYKRSNFDDWRIKFFPSTEASALEQFDRMQKYLKIVFLAAAKPGLAGNRDQLPAVCLSLAEWLEQTRQNFKLGKQIDVLMEDETRHINRSGFDISALLADHTEAKKKLAVHGIDFSTIKSHLKKHAVDHWLVVEDEFKEFWSPSDRSTGVCETRKLMKKAKCWIVAVPSDSNATQLLKLMRDPPPQSTLS